ncbi:MAG: hypothetical protein JST51_01495 [Armatimonadetes bacterium]|nr:hypothetical protein [Armatimonadota bacterium]
MPSWEFPQTVTVTHYAAPVDPSTKVASLPASTGTETMDCDVQLRTPGSVYEKFGVETSKPAVVYTALADKAKIRTGSTFEYQGDTYVFRTEPGPKSDGSGLDYAIAVADVLNYG